MESIFFRRLEPRRSTQAILPNVTSLGGFGNINPSAGLMPVDMMNPQYTTQPSGLTYGNILGSCPRIDSPGLQSVVGTLGDIYSRGSSSYNSGQYNVGTYNWGGYNLGVGNVLGSCPNIDSPGLQSVVGTLGNIFRGGTSNTYSTGFNVSSFMSGPTTCYDYNWPPRGCYTIFVEPCSFISGGCDDFGYTPPGCFYIGGGCLLIGGGCFLIGGGGCDDFGYTPPGCLYIGGGCLYIGGGCPLIGGCTSVIYY